MGIKNTRSSKSSTGSSKGAKAAEALGAPATLWHGMSVVKAKLLGASLGLASLAVAGSFVLLSGASSERSSRTVAGRVAPASSVALKNGPRGAKGFASGHGALTLHAPASSSRAHSEASQLALAADSSASDLGGSKGAHEHGSKKGKGAESGADASAKWKTDHRVPTTAELDKIRQGLLSPDPKDRLAALRLARTLDSAELAPDIRALLQVEQSAPVKRVAVQVLALEDPAASENTFESTRSDADAVVRVNSAFGMARNGDDAQAAWLLKVYDASRVVAPRLVPVLGAALEDPSINAPSIVARFQQIAANPKLPSDVRAHASAIAQAKQNW